MKNFSAKNAEFETLKINNEAAISSADLGTAPNQIPLNKDLGGLAYQDAVNLDDVSADMLELRAIAAEISDSAVDVFVYDTSRDSDGGAWRKRTQHTSWYNEELNTETRGGRREFPAVAVIVAEAGKVAIYDGDDPDLSMWMVFQQGSVLEWASTSSNCTSLSFLNGVLVVGSRPSSVILFNFLGDDIKLTYFQNQYFLTSGRFIVDRNNSISVSAGGDGIDIVNNNVNDVAMTILPNAPIDQNTGLPVPTIAVATDGGVSVIKDDGTVVDIPVGGDANHVSFTKNNLLVLGRESNIIYVGEIPASDIDHVDWRSLSSTTYVGSAGADLICFDDDVSALESLTGNDISVGYDADSNLGLLALSPDTNIPTNGLLSYITSKYNTGWMPGDIKLATLIDSTVETVGRYSGQLIVNDSSLPIEQQAWVGNFDLESDLDSWTKTGDVAGITITGGKLRIERTTTLTHATYVMSVVKGVEYQVSADIQLVSGGGSPAIRLSKVQMVAGSSLVTGDLHQSDNTRKFRADYTGLLYISAYHGADVGVSDFDNISVRATTELITNGDFSNGITGWSEFETGRGVYEYDSGTLKITATGSNPYLGQDLPTIIGKDYVVSIEVTATTASSLRVQFGGMNFYPSGVGVFSYTITATSTTTRLNIQLLENATSNTVNYDNISVRPAEEDRSVNNNGLQIVGAIDKTRVAPGADLVAYSGFSANDYLVQPYNQDLDFGTGDFCVMGWAKTTSTANQKIFTRDLDLTNRFQVYINNGGVSVFTEEDDQSSYLEGSTDVNNGSWFNFYCIRRSGMFEVYVNGKKENAQESSDSAPRNVNFGEIPGYVGKHIHNTSNSFEGSIALLRISKTAPTADQIAKIYRDEKALFQDGAQATLYGTSDAVTALAYDDSNQLLHVGTASGRSDFRGLVRVNNTTTAISNSISAAEGTIIQN